MMLRQLRKSMTVEALRAGMLASQRSSAWAVEMMRHGFLAGAKACLPLRARLARNMEQAGLYRKGLVDRHFERLADQFTYLMHIFRAGFVESGVPQRFRLDESFRHVEQAYALGRGVINAAPHLCCYPLYPPVVSPRIPCSIYLRRSPDPRKHEIDRAIGRAAKGHLIYPPRNASRTERLIVAMRVLREGRMLYITPDVPRRYGQGVPVRLLGRTVFFPTGMIIMSMRTGAPIVPITWHYEDSTYCIHCHEPMTFSKRGNREAQAAAGMKKWAETMDACLRAQPELWWNWLDKRWTQIVRGEGDYGIGALFN